MIVINAPMWSLYLSRVSTNNHSFPDVEFRFRGIEIVRKAMTALAAEYLESEHNLNRGGYKHGKRGRLPFDQKPRH